MKCGLYCMSAVLLTVARTHHVKQRFSVYMPPHPLHEPSFTVVLKYPPVLESEIIQSLMYIFHFKSSNQAMRIVENMLKPSREAYVNRTNALIAIDISK